MLSGRRVRARSLVTTPWLGVNMRKKTGKESLLFVLAALTICPATLLAQDSENKDQQEEIEVVVTANRVAVPREQVGSSITVVDGQEAEDQGEQTVAEALRSVPSVDVVRSGAPGGNTSIFIRGANAEHTLVLIDGVEANNPVTPARQYNFADLSLEDIEKIEVLRGPQSTLYGSDAMAGVVNIITRRGSGPAQARASFEGGSYNTFTERAGLSGGGKTYDYSFGFLRNDSAGFSAASKRFGNTEDDGYRNTSFSGQTGYKVTPELDARVIARYIDAKSDLDNFGGTGGDDPNRVAFDRQFFGRGQFDLSSFDKLLENTVGFSSGWQDFEDNNNPDLTHPLDLLRSDYTGVLNKADWQTRAKLASWMKLIGGAETQVERASSSYFSDGSFGPFHDDFPERSATTNSFYLEALPEVHDWLYSSAGVRVDSHSQFGSQVTYRFAPAVLIEQTHTKFSASVGSGFKAPSLFQLYSSYGSPTLAPEKSLGLDGGVEQSFFEKDLRTGLTYFWNKFDELITFDAGTFKFENTAKATTQGFEAWSEYRFCDWVSSGLSYSYTDTLDQTTHQSLIRRPRHKLAWEFVLRPLEHLRLSPQLLYVGKRFDNNYGAFPAERVALGGYSLFNLSAGYELSENLELFGRIDNLFDKNYQEVYGYGVAGFTIFGGLRVKI
jgi:vitamin B12 transporter